MRPNLLFLLPDQLRADFLGCYGGRAVPTPHVDGLADRGVRYRNAISASPLCVPARTALLTGMDAVKNGVLDNEHFLRADYASVGIRTWPEILASAGYFTAAVGKMHYYPWDARLGFARRVVAEDKRWPWIRDDLYHTLRRNDYRKYHGEEFDGYHENKGAIVNRLPRTLTPDGFVGEQTCDFLRTYDEDKPFALMVGFPGPHCPYDPHPDSFQYVDTTKLPQPIDDTAVAPRLRAQCVEANQKPWNKVDYTEFPIEAQRRIRVHYAGLVKQIDDEIGRILHTLDSTGRAENTVVILASDHGDYLGDHGMIGKGSFFESAIRTPLIVAVPGTGDPIARDDLVELHDVTATLLLLAGCQLPAWMDARPLPGVTDDLGSAEPDAGSRKVIVGMLAGGWMAFDGRWKLHKYDTGEVLLFDLDNDPEERNNLVDDPDHLGVYRRLDATLTGQIMTSIAAATHDRQVGARYEDKAFGHEGWQRPYPHPLAAASRARATE